MGDGGTNPKRSPSGQGIGWAERALGNRLWLIGRAMEVAAFVVLALAGFAAYRLWHEGRHLAVAAPLFAGGVLGLALLRTGGSAVRRGMRYLSGEQTVAGVVGRLAERWAGKRPGGDPTRWLRWLRFLR